MENRLLHCKIIQKCNRNFKLGIFFSQKSGISGAFLVSEHKEIESESENVILEFYKLYSLTEKFLIFTLEKNAGFYNFITIISMKNRILFSL